jgi:flagella basal body P-ring formation protein FlgA
MHLGNLPLLFLFALPVFGSDLSTVIAFKSGAVVDGSVSYFSLDSVLSIEGGNSGCQARLGSVRMRLDDRNAPEVVSRQDVMMAIERSIEDGQCPIQWRGISLLRLTSPIGPSDLHHLTEEAAKRLKTALSEQYQDVVVTPIGSLDIPDSVAPGTKFEILPPLADRVSRRMAVDIAVDEPGHAIWRLSIWFSVSAMKEALRVPSDISIHQDVGAVPMQTTMIDWAEIDGLALPAAFDLKGYWAIHAMAAGTVLKKGDVARRPDIVVGDSIAVRFSAGAIVVETSAVALQSGFVGDRILVRNERSQSDIMGEINKPGYVEVGP